MNAPLMYKTEERKTVETKLADAKMLLSTVKNNRGTTASEKRASKAQIAELETDIIVLEKHLQKLAEPLMGASMITVKIIAEAQHRMEMAGARTVELRAKFAETDPAYFMTWYMEDMIVASTTAKVFTEFLYRISNMEFILLQNVIKCWEGLCESFNREVVSHCTRLTNHSTSDASNFADDCRIQTYIKLMSPDSFESFSQPVNAKRLIEAGTVEFDETEYPVEFKFLK